MKVAIIGAYPPPIGGNSVHIKRLHDALMLKGAECAVIDMYGRSAEALPSPNVYRIGPAGIMSMLKCVFLMRHKTYDIIHFHVAAMERFLYAGYFLMYAAPTDAKKVITIHHGLFVKIYHSLPKIKKTMTASLLRRFCHIIVVNHGQKALLENIGIPPQNISVIHAYIPPSPKKFPEADAILHNLTMNNRTLIVSSGYGLPLYGYHRIVAAIKSKPALSKKVSLLLCLYNHLDKEYMEHLTTSTLGLESVQILRDLDAEQFAYLLSKSQLYIRATDVDGDAVAIREAAHFGVTVIASSIGERPEYCHLFELDDVESLANQLLQCVASRKLEGDVINPPASIVDNIFNIYSDTANLEIK